MARRVPKNVPYQTKISVQDVNNTKTDVGIGMENEEMRRLALHVEQAIDLVKQVAAGETPAGLGIPEGEGIGDKVTQLGDSITNVTNIIGEGGSWAFSTRHNSVVLNNEGKIQSFNFIDQLPPDGVKTRCYYPVYFTLQSVDPQTITTINDAKEIEVKANVCLYPDEFGVVFHSTQDPTAGFLDSKIKDSIVADYSDFTIHLDGDDAAPGNNYFYGTDGTGDKGWYAVSGIFPGGSDNYTLRYDVVRGWEATNIILMDDSDNSVTIYGDIHTDDVNSNTFLGVGSGGSITSGSSNTLIGGGSGESVTEGLRNTFVGKDAGEDVTTGDDNVAIGNNALNDITTTDKNTAVGTSALSTATGSENTAVGYQAGAPNASGNVCIGYQAGSQETGSDTLYIENSNSASPLIYGEFDNDIVVINGSFGVNASPNARIHASTGGTDATPVMILDQNDQGEPFIDFQATAGAATTYSISTNEYNTFANMIKVDINGSQQWLKTYTPV